MAAHMLHVDLEAGEDGYTVTNTLTNVNPFGLEIGDVVMAINDTPVAEISLETLMGGMMRAGRMGLSVTVERAGETLTLEGSGMGGMFGLEMMPGMGGMDGRGFRFHMNPDMREGLREGLRGRMPFQPPFELPQPEATEEAPADAGQA
jgi:hypothetical protein